ncbi:MAG: molybdenum cofactor guanylyltransferase [Halobacteriota archaeon]|nr:molybdenum cofactor guanylyltransferase [Halobacteriota archaeon]
MRSAVILCGGKSSRFNCVDKTFVNFGMKPLIRHVLDPVSKVVDEIIISTKDEERVRDIKEVVDLTSRDDIKIVFDKFKGFGPVAGILSGLQESSSEYSIVLACDLPFARGDVITLLFSQALGYDAAIPRWENNLIEPLYSIYKRDSMIDAARVAIKEGFHNVYHSISLLEKVNYVPIEDIKAIDTELITFSNINTLEDLKNLQNRVDGDWNDF